MTMQAEQLMGAPVLSSDGQAVGTVEGVFHDDVDGTPSWARIRSGKGARFVPLAGGRMTKSGLSVPFDTQKIVNEPALEVDRHMSIAQEDELRRYFGITAPAQTERAGYAPTAPRQPPAGPTPASPASRSTPGQPAAGQAAGQAKAGPGQVGSGPAGPGDQAWIIRAEERVSVGTERVESGRARMRKYVDSEPVEQTVRLAHDEYEVERAPITSDERISGTIGEDEQEIILYEERAVIRKEAVPVERVRLSARKVAQDKMVRGEIRRERIEVETDPVTPSSKDGQVPANPVQPRSYSGQHRSPSS